MARNIKSKKVTVERDNGKQPLETSSPSLIQRLQDQVESNQSYLSLVLGLLIVFVVGVLIFNYLRRDNVDLGPAQQTTQEEQAQDQPLVDADPNNLPGKYTIKDGDTLFKIAQRYYNDGYKFPSLIQANKLDNENVIEVGQVLDIPKLEEDQEVASAQESPTPTEEQEQLSPTPAEVTPAEQATPAPTTQPQEADDDSVGTGGAENQTIWGEKITGDTYVVVSGDWLSKVAGRAYGDVMKYQDLAKANNITNPDLIVPGQVLKIPR